MTASVFISYSRKDGTYVDALAAHLKGNGVPVWYDFEVDTGDVFATKIQRAIDDCVAFVLVATPSSVSSTWVQREFRRAVRLGKPVLPLLREHCDTPLEIEGIDVEDVTDGGMPGSRYVRQLTGMVATAAVNLCVAEWEHAIGPPRSPVMTEASSALTPRGFYRPCTRGTVCWTPIAGAQAILQGISHYFDQRGRYEGRLGFPAGGEHEAATSRQGTDGVYQRFEERRDYPDDIVDRWVNGERGGATVYWSRLHGAHATWGGIGEHYERLGGTGSRLGFPVSDEDELEPTHRGTRGWMQRFEGGSLYWSESTGAITVWGAVESYFDSRGATGGRLGFPLSAELEGAVSPQGTRGVYQRFERTWEYPPDVLTGWGEGERGGATIYWSEEYGAHATGGGIGVRYEREGGPGGFLGYPTSDSVRVASTDGEAQRSYQEFEGGTVYWTSSTDTVTVAGPVVDLLRLDRSVEQSLGFPTTAEASGGFAQQGRVQFFEHGVVTIKDGIAEAWSRPG